MPSLAGLSFDGVLAHHGDVIALALSLAVLVAAVLPAPADGGSCGGNVACQCGDTVAEDYRLTQPLGPCSGHGLVVKSSVRLDCNGQRVTGLGNGSDQYGIYLEGREGAEVVGATVTGCHVSGFLRGIRLRAARGNAITRNVLTGNGNFATHEGYGIDVAGASVGNRLEGNRVERSADEGIHIGRDSHRNHLVDNEITNNHRESLYVLGADEGVFLRNTLGGGGSNSAYVKDSSRNRFEDNRFVGRPVRIIGDSRDNVLSRNTFAGAWLHFQDYKGGARPRGNRVIGGSISDAREQCVRFTNSGDNALVGVSMVSCRTSIRAASPAGPTRNMVIGLGDARVELDAASTILAGWLVGATVRDPEDQPVPGAEVAARDGSGPLWKAVTDASGAIPAQVTVTASRTGSSPPRSAGPVTITVQRPGFAPYVEERAVTGDVDLRITLKPE